MSVSKMALMLGDVSGIAGISAVMFDLKNLKKEYSPSIVVANGENSEAGYGISAESASKLFEGGVDVITTGNHAFEFKGSAALFNNRSRLLRPENFMTGNPGTGSVVVETGDGLKIGVINLHTPSGINMVENLYTTAEKVINRMRKETNIILVDLHGEYAHQKEAFAFEFDGRVTAVCGTHTHVQTMDEKILKGGTAYITDMGMCGVQESVIGGDIALSIKKMLSGVNIKIPVLEGEGSLKGVAIGFDASTGRALSIERF